MSQHIVLNAAVKHIVDNFNIFGFGNEETALLQSIKELLENSFDAFKAAHSTTSPRLLSANVSISSSSNSNKVVVDVSDEGCGIEDPAAILRCFQSSKTTTSTSTTAFNTGRFGVGLSTCLVYSLVKLGTPMRLITKCKDNLGATVSDYSMNTDGNPSCVQNRFVSTNGFLSGTKIRIELPMGGPDKMNAIKRVVRAMETYLIRFDILPTTFIATGFSVSVGGLICNLRCSGHDPFLASMVLQSESLLATRFRDRFNEYLLQAHLHSGITSGSTDNTTIGAIAAQTTLRRRCSDAVSVVLERADFTVVVVLFITEAVLAAGPNSVTSATDRYSGNTPPQSGEAHHNLVPTDCFPLQIWRYVNHVPLLDYGEDALSCCTSSAVRAVKWGDFGYRLRLSLEGTSADSDDDHLSAMADTTGTTAATSTSAASSNPFQPPLCPAPHWELQVQSQQRPELCALLQTHQPRALLALDVVANHVPYANMRKTALGKDNPTLTKLITDGVQAVLAKLDARHSTDTSTSTDDNRGTVGADAAAHNGVQAPAAIFDEPLQLQNLFCSKKTYQTRLMRDKYLPSIAASVARMVACSQDTRYAHKVQRLLHLPTTAESRLGCDTDSDSDGDDESNSGGEEENDGCSQGRGTAAAPVLDQQALRRAIEEALLGVIE